MIELKDARLAFGAKRLFDNISFCVHEGETLCVRGRAGSGKTALLMTMLGMIPLDAGYVCFDGEPITATTAPMFRDKMAYVPQDKPLCDVSVVQMVDMLFELKSHDATDYTRKKLFAEWKELQLDRSLLERNVDSLKPSELQMVMLSAARLSERKVVLLDDPLAALDDQQAWLAMGCIRRMTAQGAAVVLTMTEHRPMAVCDSLVNLNELQNF